MNTKYDKERYAYQLGTKPRELQYFNMLSNIQQHHRHTHQNMFLKAIYWQNKLSTYINIYNIYTLVHTLCVHFGVHTYPVYTDRCY